MTPLLSRRTNATGRAEPARLAEGSADWLRLARTARILSWLTLAWMAVEGGVAISAALAAGSVALLGFGLDSGIEAMASVIVIWRFTGTRLASAKSERRAQQLVSISFYVLAPTSPLRLSDPWLLASAPRPASSAWSSLPERQSSNPLSG